MTSGAFISTRRFKRLLRIMTRRYKSFKSEVAKRPPSKGTRGRSSGGIIGTTLGMMTFSYFSGIGKISTIISLLYMNLLAIVGSLMLVDTFRDSRKQGIKKKKTT